MARTVETWTEILRSRNDDDAARRIMGDLIGYRHGNHFAEDTEQLANAIAALRALGTLKEATDVHPD